MNKIAFSGVMMISVLWLAGCGTVPERATYEPNQTFPTVVQEGMKPYRIYRDVQLLAPTVVPQSSDKSKSISVRNTTFSKNTYIVHFYQTENRQPLNSVTNGTMLAYFSGMPVTSANNMDFKVFASYARYGDFADDAKNPWWSKQFILQTEKTGLDKGIMGYTYRAVNRNPKLSAPATVAVAWKDGGWDFEVQETSTSFTDVIATAKQVVTRFNSGLLPTPSKFGTVSIEVNPKSSIVEYATTVTWDKEYQKKRGLYQVFTDSPCTDPILAALKMAASMRPFS